MATAGRMALLLSASARVACCTQTCLPLLRAAMGTTQDCRRQIHRELRYQSSMDLDAGTYAAIRCARRARSVPPHWAEP